MGFGHWIKKHVTHRILPKGRFRKAVDKVASAPFNVHKIVRSDLLPKKVRSYLRSWEPGGSNLNKAIGKIAHKMASSVSNSASTTKSVSQTAQKPYQLASRNTGYTLDTSYRSLNSLTRR